MDIVGVTDYQYHTKYITTAVPFYQWQPCIIVAVSVLSLPSSTTYAAIVKIIGFNVLSISYYRLTGVKNPSDKNSVLPL